MLSRLSSSTLLQTTGEIPPTEGGEQLQLMLCVHYRLKCWLAKMDNVLNGYESSFCPANDACVLPVPRPADSWG